MTCPCQALAARGDPKGGNVSSLGGLGRAKRSATGKHCVVSKKSGKTLGCFGSRAAAQKVARGFGPGFGLRSRSSR
jgi:hypothetical protein